MRLKILHISKNPEDNLGRYPEELQTELGIFVVTVSLINSHFNDYSIVVNDADNGQIL